MKVLAIATREEFDAAIQGADRLEATESRIRENAPAGLTEPEIQNLVNEFDGYFVDYHKAGELVARETADKIYLAVESASV